MARATRSKSSSGVSTTWRSASRMRYRASRTRRAFFVRFGTVIPFCRPPSPKELVRGGDPDGANLILRDARRGVQCGVCKYVGRRLGEVKREEDRSRGRAFCHDRPRHDGPATGGDRNPSSRFDAQGRGIPGMNLEERFGGQQIETGDPAGHGAGMPLLEHPSRIQKQWIFGVGEFGRRPERDRMELPKSPSEPRPMEEWGSWMIGSPRGPRECG